MIYYLVPAAITLCGIRLKDDKRSKKIYLFFAFFALWLLVALRAPSVGNDTNTYCLEFQAQNGYSNFFAPNARFEYGYVLLCRFIGLFTRNNQIMLAIFAALTMVPVAITLYRYSPRLNISIAIFCFGGLYLSSFSAIRLALCSSILLMAIKPLIERKPIQFILWILLGALFHNIGFFFLVLYPLSLLKFNKNTMLVFVILGASLVVVFPLLQSIALKLFPQYSYYFLNDDTLSGIFGVMFNLLIYYILMFLFFIVSDNYFKIVIKARLQKNGFVYYKMPINNYAHQDIWTGKIFMLIFSVGLALQPLVFRFNLIDRIANLYFNIIIIMVPFFGEKIKSKNMRGTFYLFSIAILIAKTTIILLLRPEWLNVLPYRLFF